MKWDRMSVQEGMFVTSTTGQRIGKVIRCDAETFVVEKGALFPKDYQLRYDHITGIGSDGSITYSLEEELAREELAREKAATAERAAAAERTTAAAAAAPLASASEAKQDHEVRIPLLQEELDIEKYAYESGHVRIHKGIKVEERHFTVPVRREEVIVEHVSTKDWEPASALNASEASTAFEDQDLDIPLYEEDIRVGKHAIVREEVVVRTVARDVDVEGSASLRTEECDIEDSRGRPGLRAPGGNGTGAYASPSPR
jgi:uncharacterized protein (TIGR02271 family)